MNEDDDRSPFAVGYAKAMGIMSVGFEAVLPILLGVFVDYWFGTVVVFTFLGLLFGGYVGYTQLMKIVNR